MEGGRKQLSDFERQVIILFKSENPTWGLTKCLAVLPNFFSTITRNQFNNVVATLKREGPETASTRKKGTGPKKRLSDEARTTERGKGLERYPTSYPSKRCMSLDF